ncbi:hypothetical protein D3C84_1162810 [compost metagenome]
MVPLVAACHQLLPQHQQLARRRDAKAHVVVVLDVDDLDIDTVLKEAAQRILRVCAGIDCQADFLADAATEDEGHGSLPCDQ